MTIYQSVNAQQLKQRQNSYRSSETLAKHVPHLFHFIPFCRLVFGEKLNDKMTRFLYILFAFLYVGCVGSPHSGVKATDTLNVDTVPVVQEIKDPLYSTWNNIVDSIVSLGKEYFHNDNNCRELIDLVGELNKEDEVFKLVSPSLSENHTSFILLEINAFICKVTSSFWERSPKKRIRAGDIYTYKYLRYKTTPSQRRIQGDSIKIYHADDWTFFPDDFLTVCNKWDTVALKTDINVLPLMKDYNYVFAIRVKINKRDEFSIDFIPVIRNIDYDNLVGDPPYAVIPD